MHRFAILFATGLTLAAHATSPHAAEPIIVGVEHHSYLPVYSFDGGRYHGYARDLLDTFARDKGLEFEYRALPVPRLYASFFAGQVDLKFPDNPNWQSDKRAGKNIAYSDPVATFIDGVSVMPSRKGAGIDALKTVGTVGGFTPWALMDRIKANSITVSENSSLESLLRQTQAGRVDGTYASVAVVNYQLDQVLKQPGALVFDASLPYSRDHYYLSSIKRPDVVRDFSFWLKQNRAVVAALKAKHGVEKGVIHE